MSAIVKGSLGAIAKQNGVSVAESFVDVDALVIVDTSGSMGTPDSVDGRTRYAQACRELAGLQASLPGKVGVVAFSGDNQVRFCPDGVPYQFSGGTDVAGALKFCKIADVAGMRFVLISDGQPNDVSAALDVARTYTNRIDTIFVGDERNPEGRAFLQKISRVSGGTSTTSGQAVALADNVHRLLAVAG